MKKVAGYILLLLYLNFSTGLTLHHHYCMGDYAGSSLLPREGDACNKCGMEEKGDCCSEKQTYLKITDDQHNATFDYTSDPLSSHVAFSEKGFQFNPSFVSSIPIADHGPPGRSYIPLFIKNMIFRI